jgi:hypothetical protein
LAFILATNISTTTPLFHKIRISHLSTVHHVCFVRCSGQIPSGYIAVFFLFIIYFLLFPLSCFIMTQIPTTLYFTTILIFGPINFSILASCSSNKDHIILVFFSINRNNKYEQRRVGKEIKLKNYMEKEEKFSIG